MKRVNYRDIVPLNQQEKDQMDRYVQKCLMKVSGRQPEEMIEIRESERNEDEKEINRP
jgi:tetrahydromethanopterin S-methyltransferase subunit A